jgi:Holliday junction DNA helicase RuvB
MQLGFIDRTPRGRVATERAFDYYGIPRKFGATGLQTPLF